MSHKCDIIRRRFKEEDKKYLELNTRLSKTWPLITEAKSAPADAKEWENKPDKLKLLEE
jgi:ferredoxin